MVNYHGKFIPNRITLLALLYSLLSDEEKGSESGAGIGHALRLLMSVKDY